MNRGELFNRIGGKLPFEDCLLVDDLGDVDRVAENAIEMPPTEGSAAGEIGAARVAVERHPAQPVVSAFIMRTPPHSR